MASPAGAVASLPASVEGMVPWRPIAIWSDVMSSPGGLGAVVWMTGLGGGSASALSLPAPDCGPSLVSEGQDADCPVAAQM
jgi:hypothetical protein